MQWTKSFAGDGETMTLAATAAASGDAVVAGYFERTLTIGAFDLAQPLGAASPTSGWVARLSEPGTPRWATRVDATGASAILALAAVGDEVACAGYFGGDARFGNLPVAASGRIDAMVAFASASTGEWQSALVFGGPGSARFTGVAALEAGDVLVTGFFDGSVLLGSTELVSTGETEIVVARVARDGSVRWAKRYGGSESEFSGSLSMTASGERFALTGAFTGSVDFDGNPVTSAGRSDAFVALCQADDGRCDWVSRIGSPSADSASAVAFLGDGSVVGAGTLGGRAVGEAPRASDGTGDAFLARWSAGGDRSWLRVLGGLGSDQGAAVTTTGAGHIALAGTFEGRLPIEGGSPLQSDGSGADGFIAIFGDDGQSRWSHSFGGSGPDRLDTVVRLSNASIVFAGATGAAPVDGIPSTGSDALVGLLRE